MRLINIVGHSNSGKTTLIVRLVPMLAELGRVATLKQLGCHSFILPEGKDTTRHFEAGAECATGVDTEKAIADFSIKANRFNCLHLCSWVCVANSILFVKTIFNIVR